MFIEGEVGIIAVLQYCFFLFNKRLVSKDKLFVIYSDFTQYLCNIHLTGDIHSF